MIQKRLSLQFPSGRALNRNGSNFNNSKSTILGKENLKGANLNDILKDESLEMTEDNVDGEKNHGIDSY